MALTDAPRRPSGELDEVTLRLAQRGDARARRRLVDHYARRVFHLLSRMLSPVGRGHLVEDLAQETMLRVIGALDRFDPGGSAKLSTWIITIASRLALQELAKRRPVTVPVVEAELSGGLGTSPEAHASAQQLRRRVRAVVAAMSPQLRAAFVLTDAQGLSPAEVAEVLGIAAATARTRIHRARTEIRRALKESERDG